MAEKSNEERSNLLNLATDCEFVFVFDEFKNVITRSLQDINDPWIERYMERYLVFSETIDHFLLGDVKTHDIIINSIITMFHYISENIDSTRISINEYTHPNIYKGLQKENLTENNISLLSSQYDVIYKDHKDLLKHLLFWENTIMDYIIDDVSDVLYVMEIFAKNLDKIDVTMGLKFNDGDLDIYRSDDGTLDNDKIMRMIGDNGDIPINNLTITKCCDKDGCDCPLLI
jgi:hypothetical protein